jgi:hypothetical protein
VGITLLSGQQRSLLVGARRKDLTFQIGVKGQIGSPIEHWLSGTTSDHLT